MKSYLCHFAEKFEGQINCRPVGKYKNLFLTAQFEELQAGWLWERCGCFDFSLAGSWNFWVLGLDFL